MRKFFFIIALVFATAPSLFSQETQTSKVSLGVKAGYNSGFGVHSNITIYNLLQDSPLHLRFEVGYANTNPGESLEARRIFINNNTNGSPEKKGTVLDYRLDFLIPVEILNNSFIKVGPRYSNFKGNFNFIGGNEDFDITSNQWGFGTGLGNLFAINNNLDLEINAGFDYFLNNTLYGHSTSYSPDNENVQTRNDNQNDNVPFEFEDADKAINQPKYMPHIMVGLNYKL